jgi:para-nitrobenzyl esterase
VTIFGESAGSHAVNTLLAVPSAAGLFHRAICQSTASGLVVSAQDAVVNARQFAKYLGATDSNAAETVLSAKPKNLVKALFRLIGSAKHIPGLSLRIGPSVDGDVLPLDPVEAMERGEAHRVPLIIGYNAEEATLFTKILKILPITPEALEHALSKDGPEFVQRVVDSYHGYPSEKALLQLAGDLAFGSAAWRVAEAHGQYAPTYFYRYDYTTRALRRYGLGPTHAIELLAVFGTYRTIAGPILAGRKDRAAARGVSDEMQRRWLSFARTGSPGDGWPAHTVPERQVLIIDNPSRLEADPDGDRRPLWQDATSIV